MAEPKPYSCVRCGTPGRGTVNSYNNVYCADCRRRINQERRQADRSILTGKPRKGRRRPKLHEPKEEPCS